MRLMPGRLGEEGEGMEAGFTSGFLTLGVVFPKKRVICMSRSAISCANRSEYRRLIGLHCIGLCRRKKAKLQHEGGQVINGPKTHKADLLPVFTIFYRCNIDIQGSKPICS